jgi:DTW domain-containing protein YfiP
VNKEAYLRRKAERESGTAAFKRERICPRCRWVEALCLCPHIQPFWTATRFVILMHPMEARKVKLGTGRLCHAALHNSEIRVGIDFTSDRDVNALIADPRNLCMVLYPGASSLNISTDDLSPLRQARAEGRRLVVFLVDATWQCAKKMMTQSLNIRNLPRISFTAVRESVFRIKQQPASYCLSTLESIHQFLEEASRRGLEVLPDRPQDSLMRVFQAMIDFAIECARDPSRASYRKGPRGYSPKEKRLPRRKTSGRNIILRD